MTITEEHPPERLFWLKLNEAEVRLLGWALGETSPDKRNAQCPGWGVRGSAIYNQLKELKLVECE